MTDREMAEWLQHFFPAIPPEPPGTRCWIARMMNRRAEHNPPFYWLGLALGIVEASGQGDVLRARLIAGHGTAMCDGGEPDDRAHGVLSEACAFAWTQTHIGAPRIEVADEGGTLETTRVRLAVPDHDTYVWPARLQQAASLEGVVHEIAEAAHTAATHLPPARGRLLYLDAWYGRGYPDSVGYHLALTEPVEAALHHYCDEAHIGHVFTRPFQWGNPVDTHY
ncbi:MAG: hypothetical protein WC273_06760 [Dehalococcoidia bacterium]